MSALVAADEPSIVVSVAAGTLPVPVPDAVTEALLYMDVGDFGFHLAAAITDFHFARESETVTLQASVGNDVIIALSLFGRLTDVFRIDEVSIDIRTVRNRPRAEFVNSTLFALLGLSKQTDLQIPAIGLDLSQRFDISLDRISQRLQMRQVAYRLMVIEQATGMEFSLPEDHTREDIETITYLYHAITDRSFVWPIGTVTVRVPATEERLALLPHDEMPTHQEFGPTRVVKNLFGHTIEIGKEELFISDAVIEGLEAVRRELACNDGHLVELTVRSLTGTGRIVVENAPRLPQPAWDSNIQTLIDLEPRLDACLADRYNALAASTLADLTDEEKREIAARPELHEDAFLINDSGRKTI